jgi:ABC-type branched-subunit amino acid transport system substrate-binding protein
MNRRYLTISLGLLLVGFAMALAGCGGSGASGQTGATVAGGAAGGTSTTLSAKANPIKIVFNGEISGPLVYDTALVMKGIRTALQTLSYRLADWLIEYKEVDNKSDPLLAVEQIRQLAEMDTNNDNKDERKPADLADFICGPLSSSDAAGVAYFLSQRTEQREKIPQCSVTGMPSENITTSGGLGFIPNGIYSSHGYYLGKFAAEIMRYKTANCIHYADRVAEELQAGFERGFIAGGGTISSVTYVSPSTVEFAKYFSTMKAADCTMFWVRGAGAIPFVQQYAASGLKGALLVPQSSNYTESQLKYLESLGVGLEMTACDVYTSMLGNAQNQQFIAAFQDLYPGEYPTPEAFGGWQAIMLYAEAVKAVKAQRILEDQENKLDKSERVDPRNPGDIVSAMATLTINTPAGSITMAKYTKTYIAIRDFYILRSKDVGAGRIAWAPLYTYSQVRMGQ